MTETLEKEPAPAPTAHVGDNVRASWQCSTSELRSNIAHCSPEGKEALVSAFLWCIDARHPVEKKEFATRVGYSENVIYRILAGKYRDENGRQYDIPADLTRRIKDFLALEKKRYAAGGRRFIKTPTAEKIWEACDVARRSQTPSFVIGPSHIGKTWALENYRELNNHGTTFYARIQAASGLGGMVRRIADRCGVSDRSNTADLVNRIKRALNKGSLLILDEVHQLAYTYRRASFFACMEVIREIYDEAECGMVLCGTKLLMQHMNEGAHGALEQLMRRGVHRCVLADKPSVGDLKCILKASRLEFPKKTFEVTVETDEKPIVEKPYALLSYLGQHHGLKAITERIRYGTMLASEASESLTWQHVVEAHLIIKKQTEPGDDWD